MDDSLLSEEYVLSPDVLITRADELSESDRALFRLERGETIYQLRQSRTPPIVASRMVSHLLSLFESAARIDDVLATLSTVFGLTAASVAKEAFPVIQRLHKSKVLVPADREGLKGNQPLLSSGQVVSNYCIKRVVRSLSDTEICLATDENGQDTCLKVFKSKTASVLDQYRREVAVLSLADDDLPLPALRGTLRHDGFPVLAIEWVEGEDLLAIGRRLRLQGPDGVTGARSVVQELFRAYAKLHARGILHGDVHPNNILVRKDESLCVLDFGYAAGFGIGYPKQRGGVVSYFEPEVARARLAGTPKPRSSEKGEQYALCLIAYEMLTGHRPYEVTADRKIAYRRIALETPKPIARFTDNVPPALCRAIARGLAKHADERSDSLEEIAELFGSPYGSESSRADRASSQSVDRFVDVYDPRRFGLLAGQSPISALSAPKASVNFGAAGLAYAFYRLSIAREDPDLLSLADVWSAAASFHAAMPDAGDDEGLYTSRQLGLERKTVGDVSVLHSAVGVELVRGLIAIARGDVAVGQRSVNALAVHLGQTDSRFEFAMGMNGLLSAAGILVDAASPHTLFDLANLQSRGDGLFRECMRHLETSISTSAQLEGFLGAAHGYAGQVHSLLLWCFARRLEPPDSLCTTVQQLIRASTRNAAGRWWPRKGGAHSASGNTASVMAGWCNGTAGHVLTLLAAHRCWPDQGFDIAAIESGRHMIREGSQNSTLCCGAAGIGFSSLALHRATGDSVWLGAARQLGMSLPWFQDRQDHSHSLFKGSSGPLVFKADLEAESGLGTFPIFELEGWSKESR